MSQYLQTHWLGALIAAGSGWISLALILRLWLAHRQDPFLKKLRWSLLLLLPFVGWVFYGAFYSPLAENDVRANREYSPY